MLWGHILPVQKRNSPKNVKRARNTFNLIKNVSAAFNLNLKSLLELKLETQITVQWISLKTNISMVAGESPEWKCYIRKNCAIFRRDPMIADCALRQNRQQIRKLSFSKLLYSWLFHFPSEGGFSKMPFIRTLRVNDERSTLRLHFVLMLTPISTREKVQGTDFGRTQN